eukprot:5232494-Ditylum_brightwellii.AAC.1
MSHEFGKTRGSIHSHLIGNTDGEEDGYTEQIGHIFADLSDGVVAVLLILKTSIEDNHIERKHSKKCDSNPLNTCGRQVSIEYEETIKLAEEKAGDRNAHVLESYCGLHAMHPGEEPSDWVEPGDLPDMGYCSNIDGMMDAKDVVKKRVEENKVLTRDS